MSMRTCVALALVCTVAASGVRSAGGAETTFTIDPSQSSLTFSGTAFSITGQPPLEFDEQGPGSLTTTLSGDVIADMSAGTVALTGGAWVLANSGNWLPGGAASNFGFQGITGSEVFGSLTGAVHGAAFTPSAAAVAHAPIPGGFEFTADGLALTGTAGTVDFDGEPDGSILGALAGTSVGLDTVVSTQTLTPVPAGTYTNIAGFETLTIPVHVLYAGFITGHEIDWQLQGTIVATRGVPEPTSLALVALAAGVTLARRRRA